jgi:hypothetical protein
LAGKNAKNKISWLLLPSILVTKGGS